MPKPRVFISWSKARSKAVAEALYDWLPTVMQNVETWMSTADINKGTKWREVLTGELATANFGIICLTPENLTEPWLLFEAGALSKTAGSRIWTYLFDLEFTDVKDPLSEFQHTLATREDTLLLVRSISQLAADAVPQA
jgi:TIR domain